MVKKEIPEMVRELRGALGLTQEQFAAKLGVTFTTVNRWENSKGKLSLLAMLRSGELQNGGIKNPSDICFQSHLAAEHG
jgi:DNA-binding XRE family transcriptional regulator